MKKIIVLILICTMSICFIGCTKKDTTTKPKEVNGTTIDTEETDRKDITKDEYIDKDEKTGLIYENNVVVIVFSIDATEEDVNNIVKTIPGSKIRDKSMADLNIYLIELDKTHSLDELNELCDMLIKSKYVDSATPNYVSEIGLDNE